MTSKPPSRTRSLTAEEAELWTAAMRDAKALRRQRAVERRHAAEQQSAARAFSGKVEPGFPSENATEQRVRAPFRFNRNGKGSNGLDAGEPAKGAERRISADRPARRAPSAPPPPSNDAAAPALSRFEERRRRKLARNAESIDARLDLHGMRQRQAHAALRGFLFASAARGDRNVLIITGKGTRGDLERGRDYTVEERGVLRRLVPQWLADEAFQAIVLSYTAASIRHGGDGALYVRLRKPLR
jgi:DNA-nicking Smr family endonuclease